MRRTFAIDVLECPRYGKRLRLLALSSRRASWNASGAIWAFRPTGPSRSPLVPRRDQSMMPPYDRARPSTRRRIALVTVCLLAPL